jgi:hypothetical protein
MASGAEAAEKMQPSQKIALSDLKPIGGRRKRGDQMSLSKKIAQNVAQPKSILNWRKLTKKIWATCNFFIKKTAHSKHSPDRRKFAESGHLVRKRVAESLLRRFERTWGEAILDGSLWSDKGAFCQNKSHGTSHQRWPHFKTFCTLIFFGGADATILQL